MGFGGFLAETDPMVWVVRFLIKAVIALPLAFLAEKKGYGYGRFFLSGLLLDPISVFVVLLIIPGKKAGSWVSAQSKKGRP